MGPGKYIADWTSNYKTNSSVYQQKPSFSFGTFRSNKVLISKNHLDENKLKHSPGVGTYDPQDSFLNKSTSLKTLDFSKG